MKVRTKERGLTLAVGVLTLVVLVLAVLQYRWTNQVSEATGVRLADSLRMSMIGWHLELFRNIAEISLSMRAAPGVTSPADLKQYARGYQEWKKAAAYPQLVANLYVSSARDDGRVLRFNPATSQFEPIPLPAALSRLSEELERQSARILQAGADSGPVLNPLPAAPPNLQVPEYYYRVGDPLAGWQFEPTLPALLYPVVHNRPGKGSTGSARRSLDWIIIELNPAVLRERVFPELAQRYFQGTEGLDYQVAVVAGSQPRRVLYSSDSGFGLVNVHDADAVMNIFVDAGRRAGTPLRTFQPSSDDSSRDVFVGTSWFPLLRTDAPGSNWRLIVRHRGTSHGAFVAEMRRRDLTISFGVLMSLAISIGIVIATSSRARRLANAQMEFVTTVSHELRTPLAVISSAADNLADGIVSGKQQSMEYGAVIKNQSRQLRGMVENILLFTSTRNGQQQYSLISLELPSVISAALANTATLIQAAGFQVEQQIEQDLPPVIADRSALTQCLQNLITNAVKYGGAAKWIGIVARTTKNPAGKSEVEIQIADRGLGISKADLKHIFEPFYRSPSVAAAQIHGTGLGLALAKSIAEAMHGYLTVHSTLGQGSTFTLHLPVSAEVKPAPEALIPAERF